MLKTFRTTALALLLGSTGALAQESARYEITITNITPGQTFTPQLVVTHPGRTRLFTLGEPASQPREFLAEAGSTVPLTEALEGNAWDVKTIDGLLGPGESVSTRVTGRAPGQGFISMAAMLIPTNDTFVALNRVRLHRNGMRTYMVPAYDSGTEPNDQNCLNIPGPRCGGEDYNPEGGEGVVHIGNGFHQLADDEVEGGEVLGPLVYDWRNPVAKVVVRRLN